MGGRPLWELAKNTLTYQENLFQFTSFLKSNSRKHHHSASISFPIMFQRVAVLLMFFQSECIIQHWWLFLYFCIKAALLFKVSFEKRQAVEVVCMLAAFHLLDYVTKLIPFMNLLYWYVNVTYFLFGIEEKYLSLNLMMLPIPSVNKSIVVTLLGLGRTKKAAHYSHLICYLDVGVLLVSGRVKYSIWFLLVLGLVQAIKVMDERMIYTKKNYAHIDEIPSIEQYH